MSPIWVKFLANWGEITLKIDRFYEVFMKRHKRVCYSQKIYPRSPKNLHGYIRHIRDIFQLWRQCCIIHELKEIIYELRLEVMNQKS